MELKRYHWRICASACTTINRTKVELKLVSGDNAIAIGELSIVPKWNWNTSSSIPLFFSFAINRTKVELKLTNRWLSWEVLPLSIVPKWNWNNNVIVGSRSLNLLSIVPKWNWNTEAVTGVNAAPIYYQSYQSGIETTLKLYNHGRHESINRTKVELKHCLSKS